ncbi:MAG: hypothetical protein Ta2D_01260 [Rickettsiales bacterium]|nr:MAG: hypothetical protein Ta2D_01260 [Rickettsiales bacterium]
MNIDKARSIGKVSIEVGLKESVLRFWQDEFPNEIKPAIGKNGRRIYYDKNVQEVLKIKYFLYEKGYKIQNLKNLLQENKSLFKKNLDEIKQMTAIKEVSASGENFAPANNIDLIELEGIIKELEVFRGKMSELIDL